MKHSHPQLDAIRKFQREAITARKAGKNTRCVWCGEARLKALVRSSKPTRCAKCNRQMKDQITMDKHHPAGRSNSKVTVTIPVNDHRAVLSVAQYDWPKATLENTDDCPLLAAAACIRGFIDTICYLIDELLRWIAKMLEILSAVLNDRLGPQWWLDTPLAQFARKDKDNVAN
jgi:hypothetical protein